MRSRTRSVAEAATASALLLALAACAPRVTASPDAARVDSGASERDAALDDDADVPRVDAGSALPHFVDVTEAAGLAIADGAPRDLPDCLIDDVTAPGPGDYCDAELGVAGAATGDFDGDGDPDLVITRVYGRAALYENLGDGTFRDASEAQGFTILEATAGAAFGDIDRDGDLDLYVTVLGGMAHRLFVREADRYVERGGERGAALAGPAPLLGTTPSFADYDGDGDLDLYVGEWRHRYAVHDGPSMARLLRNRGPAMPGFFEDVTDAAGVSMENAYDGVVSRGVYVFDGAFADLDGDRSLDLAVAGDFRTARLFFGRGDGTFVDRTVEANVGTESNAMGITFGDFDADGDLDTFVTSITMPVGLDSGNRLYRNDGARSFTDVTDAAGVRDAGWGWGTAFLDYDNDGDPDLVATNGWVLPDWANDPMRLWRNDGALPFVEVAAREGLADRGQGRGLVVLDVEGDGDLDVFVARYGTTPILYRNERGAERPWIRVRARGTTSAIDGSGARVFVRVGAGALERMIEIGTTTSFLGQSERVAHVGLGDHVGTIDSVRVVFPSGREVVLRDVEPRREIEVVEP